MMKARCADECAIADGDRLEHQGQRRIVELMASRAQVGFLRHDRALADFHRPERIDMSPVAETGTVGQCQVPRDGNPGALMDKRCSDGSARQKFSTTAGASDCMASESRRRRRPSTIPRAACARAVGSSRDWIRRLSAVVFPMLGVGWLFRCRPERHRHQPHFHRECLIHP